MEIERKWLTDTWPTLPETDRIEMRQGYLSLGPTVRIRSEHHNAGTDYVLCIKGAGTLAREEIELPLTEEQFARLEQVVGRPLIEKQQRRYALPDGLVLEVNRVDAGQPGEFFYAEVEFSSVQQALLWEPGELAGYLTNEVTNTPGQSMGEYWRRTRL